jgi:hypothetical protein
LTSISNTQLLLFQTNQGENNHRFVDETTRKDWVTRVGDVHMGSFTPFSPIGWSANFNGLSDAISSATSATLTPQSTFTVETWIYMTSANAAASGGIIVDNRPASTNGNYFQIGVGSANISVYVNSATLGTTTTAPIQSCVWYHVAYVRTGGVGKIYINGTQQASFADTTTYLETSMKIGYASFGSGWFTGYMSNFRYVNGLAVYTGNFTPPTATLGNTQSSSTNVAAITSGSTFLTFQDNRFKDNGVNAFAVNYLSGTPRIQPFSPFRTSVNYDPATHGGSARFDGGADYLYYPPGPTFNFRTFDFTIEAWVYLPANQAASASIVANNSNPNGWYFFFNASNFVVFANFSTVAITSTIPVRVGEWTHVAIRRAGTAMTMYFNGLQIASATNSTTYGDPAAVTYVGTNSTAAIFNGFISGLRVVKGQSLFTGNFAVPTAPPGLTQTASTNVAAITTANSVSNVSMLSTFTQAAFYDLTGRNDIQTIATARVSNVVSKYGGGSLYFPTQAAAFQMYTHPHVTTFAANFTIECWVYPTDEGLINTWGVIDGRQSGGTASPWQIGLNVYSAGPPAGWLMFFYNGTLYQSGGTRIRGNVWTHLAWERVSSTMTFYVDGVTNGTATVTGTIQGATTNPIYIGTKDNGIGGYGSTGYIDDLRITNGIARYNGAAFNVPTSRYLNK